MTNDEWEQRLVLAATLQDQGLDCPTCTGTGGWPGLGGGRGPWVPCKACDETGLKASSGTPLDGNVP